MQISFQDDTPQTDMVAFQRQVFPERGAMNEKLSEFRYDNPLHKGDFVRRNIVAKDGAKVIGQALYHPTVYHYDDTTSPAEWGFDFFVDPSYRNETPGIHILEFAKNNKGTLFASGVGEKALKIHKAFGYSVIGHLRKFVKLANPFFLPIGLLRARHLSASQYPESIGAFKRIGIDELWNGESAYNKDVIEFSRDAEFLRWRFFSKGFHYAVYRADGEKPAYFVVRTVKIKNITSVVLADYRFDLDNPADFDAILSAVSKLAKKLWLPIIVSGSSTAAADAVFLNHRFRVNGKDRPVVCNDKSFRSKKDKITARSFVFSTLADSDGEYSL